MLFSTVTTGLKAQTPTPPNGKKWQKIDAISDEFNGNSLNTSKWTINDPQWEGRRPGRFEESSVAVSDGKLKITASKKNNPYNGWTHNGGLVRSKTRNLYGYYEARMKANKTFMSSTFWLINKRNEFTGCDYRTTELDVTENIGRNTGGQSWIDRNMVTLNANTHSRGTSCSSTPVGIRGNKADIGEPAYAGYNTYGVWWKNAKECLFYLDGNFVFKINPAADFNLPMYLRMVVETYDWNPPKAGQDGMNDSVANRTTYYDWVRSYELVDDDGSSEENDTVAFINPSTTIQPQSSYTFNVNYEASIDREIVVEFWSSTNWIAQKNVTVTKGSGTASITVDLPQPPQVGTGYIYKTHIRPLGTSWQDAIDRDQVDNVTVTNSNSNQLPNVSFTGVADGANLAMGVSIKPTVIATDTDGSISNVKLYLNNQFIRQENFAPYEWGHLPDRDPQLKNLSNGSYVLKATATDNDGGETSKSISFTVGSPNQQLIADGTYFITSIQNDQRLLSRGLENHSARMHDPLSFDDQKWVFTHLADNTYSIKNKGNNRYLEIPYARCGKGENVATWTSGNSNHQKWKLNINGNGVYSLSPIHCPQVGLDRAGGAMNANVQVWDYDISNANQKWNIIPAENGKEQDDISDLVTLYPNPAKEFITIKTQNPGEKVIIYNLLGAEVISLSTRSEQETVSIANLEAGLYIVSIVGKSKLQFIKE